MPGESSAHWTGGGGGGEMSCPEEELLVQMVRDFMESGSPETTGSCSSSSPEFSLGQHACLMLEGLLRTYTDAEMGLLEKAVKYVEELESERKSSSVKKRLMMRLRMDGYDASLCRSSWGTTLECPGGDYEYVDVVMEESGVPTRIIVDIDFRSQFELARPTLAYAQLSAALPHVFVGKEEKLRKIVPLLCSAAQESLRESGLDVPPWRRTSYMQSKWLSCCHKMSTILLPNTARIEMKKRAGGPPPNPSSKVKDFGGAPRRAQGSALSRQFSDLSICC